MGLLDEIEAMAPRLRRVALALTGDMAAADDLVAHTLDRALARRHHLRDDGPIAGWMWRTLMKRHRDCDRGKGAHLVLVDGGAAVAAEDGPDADIAALRAVVARLPVDARQALALTVIDGQGLDEAAATLGLTEDALVARLARARSALGRLTGSASAPAPRRGKA